MENQDDLSVLTALLDDDSDDMLTDAADEVENRSTKLDLEEMASDSKSKTISPSSRPSSKVVSTKEASKLVITNRRSQKRKADEMSKGKPSSTSDNTMWDKFSGLNVVNPLISSFSMSTKMEGRKFIPVSHLMDKVKGKDIDYDWVTTAVLAKKLPPKTSSNGKTYGIWKLSDLGITSANDTVALFLFGEVYKAHWKTMEGSVLALLNASVLPAKEKYSQELALSLDNPRKLMLVGTSRDFGHCLGHTRKDGKPCSNIVNKQHGEFCEYHVNSAYKKVQSRRMEFQSSSGPPKGQLLKKLHKDMSSSTFMYQGKMLQINSPPSQKSKSVSLKALENASKSRMPSEVKDKVTAGPKSENKPSEYFIDLLSLPTIGTRNLTKHLHEEKEQNDAKETTTKASASQLLKDYRHEVHNPKSSTSVSNDSPMLGRGLKPDCDIVFSKSFSKSRSKSSFAKNRALAVVHNKGPINKVDPNVIKKKRSPLAEKVMDQRVQSNINQSEGSTDDDCTVKPKKRRLLGPEFDVFDGKTDEGQRLINAKSLHVGQVETVQAERQEKYFNELERKERLEDKMKAIKEITVSVYRCKKCNYIAESASNICFEENHPLKKTTAKKRFFACKNCRTRTVSYGSILPHLTCVNCGEMNYEKTSMLMEKQGPKIGA
ncbi:hypothetical protein QZH41_003574 [Actinostola sp. cb2023]|nr:hypothetical protein QZH41_003574 [Actinostola sp. cb2023]